MTARAGTTQSTRAHRPGRIIERPRLIKLLDEADAPVILIVAPAGYGKTTLARQWARTLSGVVWVSCTPSHRDVVTFSEDVAAGIDALGGETGRFVGQYVRARNDPQRAAREIGVMLARKLDDAPVQWLVVDDYQELAESLEAEELIATLRDRMRSRLLVVARTAPSWITARNRIYKDVVEIGSSDLALNDNEVRAVLGSRPELDPLVRRARGWPAVVALAAGLSDAAAFEPVESTLHRYVAEELFASAGESLKQDLIELALLPDLSDATIGGRFGADALRVTTDAINLGFLSMESRPVLHPLLREFLLAKLDGPSHTERIARAVERALRSNAWNLALDLVLRFGLDDLIDPVLQRAYKPLVRGGRLETLRSFATRIKSTRGFPPAAVEVIDAEVALREGNFTLAASVADRAHSRLPIDHELRCRASLLAGRSHFFVTAFPDSVRAYRAAADEATDDEDRMESAFGLVATHVFSEDGDPTPAIETLRRLKHCNPTNLIRHATAEWNLWRSTGFAMQEPLAEALQMLPLTSDPHVRTAFTYTSAYLQCVRGEYRRGAELLKLFEHDVNEFELEFARPFVDWMHAFAALGQRRFGEVDRRLQRVEDAAAHPHHRSHGFNARMLRARLMLQTGEAAGALDLLQAPTEVGVFPSWRAEHIATEALALACQGLTTQARELAASATDLSRFVEVTVLARAAGAVAGAHGAVDESSVEALLLDAERFSVWDPVICALRASHALRQVVVAGHAVRPIVRQAVQRAEDAALARQLGLPTRTHQVPASVLSPRELEVLGLMARGMRNKEIAGALFVAESTVKVHVHHIFEKLGVQSRSAAVARYERTQDRYAE